jgi:hypothetical protein
MMSELVERYVNHVGRYLPEKDRTEIETELRSLIQDKLDDRYGRSPSQADVAKVLTELGDPRLMATSYGSQQYLVGPALYPHLMTTLRIGWMIIPSLAVVLNLIDIAASSAERTLIELAIELVAGAAEASLMFSAIVVLVFAILQHSGVKLDLQGSAFDPLKLPAVDDPRRVNRIETAFGITTGVLVSLALLNFVRIGGLSLSLNPSDPGNVIPIAMEWIPPAVIAMIAMAGLQIFVMVRNSWSVVLWVIETALEVFIGIALYFALWIPLFDHLLTVAPNLAKIPGMSSAAIIIGVSSVAIALINGGSKLISLWNRQRGIAAPLSRDTDI